MNLSLIIPAYNEAKRLPKTLEEIRVFFANASEFLPYEVIVVDDGSSDHTNQIAESFEDRMPVRCIRLAKNRGKGAATREGVKHSSGKYILLYDADGATPIKEVRKLFCALKEKHADIAVGSRVKGEKLNVKIAWHRRFVGRVYYLVCMRLVPNVRDRSCGCKLFASESACRIFSIQQINRFAFDVEVLSLGHGLGYSIAEVPVEWSAIPGSKVNLFWDSLGMLFRTVQFAIVRRQRLNKAKSHA